jgi:hypothetical protein
VWDCNWQAFQVFIRMSTQWRVSMSGATGLDYQALPVVAPREFASEDWPAILDDIRICEDAVLELMRAKRG